MFITEKLAGRIAGLKYGDLPPAVVAKAKECILDCVGCIVAGSADPIHKPLRQYVESVGGNQSATLIGLGGRTSVTTAALVNGVHGHVLDYDDTNQMFIGHASVVIVPAIFALAEYLGSTGEDILTAFAIGSEVQWRFGEMLVAESDHYARGWHSTGTVGAFGAAAAAGWMLGLSREQMTHALGIVASEAGGFQAQFGSHCKPFHAGRSNEVGVRAALLARGGFTSAPDALESKVGLLNLVSSGFDTGFLDRFGEPWGITEPTFARGINLKTAPVCASGLGSIEGMVDYIAHTPIDVGQIASIACFVRPGSLNFLVFHRPQTGLQAKFSVEYWVAATLIHHRLGFAELTDEAVQDPDVQALIERISVSGDDAIRREDARIRIIIEMQSGETHKIEYFPAKGSPENPMSIAEISEKYRNCFAYAGLSEAAAQRSAELILSLETLESAVPIIDAIHA